MKNLVALQYNFIFPPGDTWAHLYEFEKSLADFFAAHGMEATVIRPIEGGSAGRTLIIEKMEIVALPQAPPDERRKQPGSQLKDMAERKLRAPALKFQGKK